ncbi:hypothetical protein CDL15_Pgr026863 [Punica granatum]|uniref:Uncharacterized protein n=1 Tax=Punica granatum TaxID=22663 RepID=A0A218WMQ0_PUNGR|nr:hypothetical protein CDL15_Pgr026863 [Punica granatum]
MGYMVPPSTPLPWFSIADPSGRLSFDLVAYLRSSWRGRLPPQLRVGLAGRSLPALILEDTSASVSDTHGDTRGGQLLIDDTRGELQSRSAGASTLLVANSWQLVDLRFVSYVSGLRAMSEEVFDIVQRLQRPSSSSYSSSSSSFSIFSMVHSGA